LAVHDRRIQLDLAVLGQRCTEAGIETRVVLENAHGALDRVESRPSAP